jgi:hypothetical protein
MSHHDCTGALLLYGSMPMPCADRILKGGVPYTHTLAASHCVEFPLPTGSVCRIQDLHHSRHALWPILSGGTLQAVKAAVVEGEPMDILTDRTVMPSGDLNVGKGCSQNDIVAAPVGGLWYDLPGGCLNVAAIAESGANVLLREADSEGTNQLLLVDWHVSGLTD